MVMAICDFCSTEYDKNKFAKHSYNFCSRLCSTRNYKAKNPDKIKYWESKSRKTRSSKKAEYDIIYRAKNKEKIAAYKKKWEQNKKSTDPKSRVIRNLRRRVHHLLIDKYKSDHTMNLIGCTIEEFIMHIESQWSKGMSWENYGVKGWHIDHIIPCFTFDMSKEEDQRRCFHYTNQRPLWAKDNLTRSRLEYTKEIPTHATVR